MKGVLAGILIASLILGSVRMVNAVGRGRSPAYGSPRVDHKGYRHDAFKAWIADEKEAIERANGQGALTHREYNQLNDELMRLETLHELSSEGKLSPADQMDLERGEQELAALISNERDYGRTGWIR